MQDGHNQHRIQNHRLVHACKLRGVGHHKRGREIKASHAQDIGAQSQAYHRFGFFKQFHQRHLCGRLGLFLLLLFHKFRRFVHAVTD